MIAWCGTPCQFFTSLLSPSSNIVHLPPLSEVGVCFDYPLSDIRTGFRDTRYYLCLTILRYNTMMCRCVVHLEGHLVYRDRAMRQSFMVFTRLASHHLSLSVVSAPRGTVRTALPKRKQPSQPKMMSLPSSQRGVTVVDPNWNPLVFGPALTTPVDQDRHRH